MAGLSLSDRPRTSGDAMRTLVDASNGLDEAFCSVSQRTLRALLNDADLLRDLPPAAVDQFSRRLLFCDPGNRFGIWVLTWPPGCQTPIHSHHCACAFGVYQGSLDEVSYATEPGSDAAIETARFTRDAGYVGGGSLDSGLVHEMLNTRAETAVSVHIYAYRPDRHQDSIEQCFVHQPHAEDI